MTRLKALMRLDRISWIRHSMLALTDQSLGVCICRPIHQIGLLSHERSTLLVNPIVPYLTVRLIFYPKWFWKSIACPFSVDDMDSGMWCRDKRLYSFRFLWTLYEMASSAHEDAMTQRCLCGHDRSDFKNKCADSVFPGLLQNSMRPEYSQWYHPTSITFF